MSSSSIVRLSRGVRRIGIAALLAVTGACASDRPRAEPDARAVAAPVTWSDAVPPRYVRDGHTATLLGDGTVLIAGGASDGRSTEIIDPYRGVVTDGPSMTTARIHHSATMLESGRVLVVGGGAPPGTDSAEIYDPIARTFTATGAMNRPRTGQAAVRMRSGKVLVAGGTADATAEIFDPATGTFTPTPSRTTSGGRGSLVSIAHSDKLFFTTGTATATASYEIFDPLAAAGAGAWSAWTGPALPDTDPGFDIPLTGLADGRIVGAHFHTCPPFSLCDGTKTTIIDTAQGGGTPSVVRSAVPPLAGGPFDGRPCDGVGPSAVLLGDGSVMYLSTASTRLTATPTGPACEAESTLTRPSPHVLPTVVLLPGGSSLVLGGAEATVDVRSSGGAFDDLFSIRMKTARMNHAAVRLHDGRILLAGGRTGVDAAGQIPSSTTAAVETFDDGAGQFATGDGAGIVDTLAVARFAQTATTLRSGLVLITGGALTDPQDPSRVTAIHRSAELYDPNAPAGARFRLVGDMATARMDHAATLLPSGQVLISGGCTARAGVADACASATASAELFDPATERFDALPPMSEPRASHGAALLPTGNVLVVGGGDGTAEIFDTVARVFRATRASGAVRDGRTARVLPDGRVLFDGGPTPSPDIFDATTETWSFGTRLPLSTIESLWATRPSGQLVKIGLTPTPSNGTRQARGATFDPLGNRAGIVDEPLATSGRYGATFTMSRSGHSYVLGGSSDPDKFASVPWPTRHTDGSDPAARPVLDPLPERVTAGTTVSLTGHGFTDRPEGSTGTASSSASNHPVVTWVSDANDAVVVGSIVSFTDSTASWVVPATTYHGHGLLFVWSGGVASLGQPVSIDPAPGATACRNDPECGTGFCVDGVCCDRRCDAKCEGCSARRKQAGIDGVCGPVPPGHDSAGKCFSGPGVACATGEECATGFCAQGVCCDATCTGTCQACNLAAHLGVCSAVEEGACNGTCNSVKDCAPPLVCGLDGHCTAQPEPTEASSAVCGCRVVGGLRGDAIGLFAVAALALASVCRRRRR